MFGAISDWSDLDWGSTLEDTTYDQPVWADTVVQDVATQGQAVGSGGGDNWTGFFQEAAKGLIGYAVAKDAAGTKAELSLQTQRPAYAAAAVQQTQGMNMNMLMIAGAVVVAVLVLK